MDQMFCIDAKALIDRGKEALFFKILLAACLISQFIGMFTLFLH